MDFARAWRASIVTGAVFGVVACSSAAVEEAADPTARVNANRPAPGHGSPPELESVDDARESSCRTEDRRFRCSDDGLQRQKCVTGKLELHSCARGCLREPASATTTADDVCMGTTSTWSCPGLHGTKKASDGDYYLTAFGCWKDAAGVSHADRADNCVPGCLAQAKSAGLCFPGDTGKQCEERVSWYTADAGRFGCLARLEVTNPENGKSVVAVALDFGPACGSVESKVSKAVLDASGRVNRALFGIDQGMRERSLVHVVEVASSTPLGPKEGS